MRTPPDMNMNAPASATTSSPGSRLITTAGVCPLEILACTLRSLVRSHAARRRRGAIVARCAAMSVLGIHHVGLAVADLPAAVAHYEQRFGARVEAEERLDDQGVAAAALVLGEGRVELLA